MILYHGSNVTVETPLLEKCRPYKDFGRGFYLTDIKRQAQRLSVKVARMNGGTPTLNRFEFDLEEARKAGLKIKIFDGPSDEWVEFVMMNRCIESPQPAHDYDIVIGPVADDTIVRLLRLYTEHFIDKDELTKKLTFSDVTSQYFFHTESALKLLKKL